MAALGVVVLIVALVALRSPHRSTTTASSATRTIIRTVPASPSGSPRTSASSSRSPAAPRSTPRTSASSSSSSSSSSSGSGLTGALPLVVVNTVGTPNLATSAAAAFRASGWTISSLVEDTRSDIISTAAYYDPSVSNAQAVASALQQQFPAIKRVVPKFGGLPAGPIVVLLTSDYSSG